MILKFKYNDYDEKTTKTDINEMRTTLLDLMSQKCIHGLKGRFFSVGGFNKSGLHNEITAKQKYIYYYGDGTSEKIKRTWRFIAENNEEAEAINRLAYA